MREMRGASLLALGLSFLAGASASCGKAEPKAPGALVEVSMSSTVGVLLDEIPASIRERVAGDLLAQDEPFWIERATRQVELTDYRLAFRMYFYEEGEGRNQLRLPPQEIWEITLDPAGARRATIGSHDLIVIDYTFSSTILSDRASPAKSEPELARIGGTWDEPFVFPVDPELLLQRTGYACIDEAEFPSNSVDAESVRSFYDQDCDVEDAPSHEGCHFTELPDLSCVDALDAYVGKIETAMRYERVPYRHAVADRVRVGTTTHADGADLIPLDEGLAVNRIVYRYVDANDCAIQEGCVGGQGWRRLLRFDASLKNAGGKPVHVGDIDYFGTGDSSQLIEHNVYEFSACHEHYHFNHYGGFNLDTLANRYVGTKGAFCLESTTRLMNTEETEMISPYPACDYQGISAGWGDEYGASLDCQWIDITDLDTTVGDQVGRLTFQANPNGFLCEGELARDSNGDLLFEPTMFVTSAGEPVDRPVCNSVEGWDTNNYSRADVMLPADGGFVTAPCSRGQIGPMRDCGFAEIDDTLACTPGAPATLDCAVTTSGGAPMVVRLCEASHVLDTGVACVFRDSLATAVVTGSGSTIAFTCPDDRGGAEPGGRFALYTAPAWPADPRATVTCTP